LPFVCVECVNEDEFADYVSTTVTEIFARYDDPDMPFHLGMMAAMMAARYSIEHGLARRRESSLLQRTRLETYPTKIICKEFCFC